MKVKNNGRTYSITGITKEQLVQLQNALQDYGQFLGRDAEKLPAVMADMLGQILADPSSSADSK